MNICEKIDAFEKHILDRQLRIAQILGHHFLTNADGDPLSESAFAIITIGFSYFEMIEQFARGESSKSKSPEFFKGGFAHVFPCSPVGADDIARLFAMMRCGMYHTAMPTDRCGLTRELPTAIANENGVIVINPALLIDELIAHFQDFCSDLRGGHCDMQQNFETMFDLIACNAKTSSYATTNTTSAPWEQEPPPS